MATHPELAEEQSYVDHAYRCLERARESAVRLRTLTDPGRGGTHQARYERDVIEENVRTRLAQLELGDEALVFGRIDRSVDEAFHIGRLAVSDERQEPVVVDWRAPVAEPFYRATGRNPMGLARRRHFMVKGRTLLDLEDELFDLDGLEGLGGGGNGDRPAITGHGALLAALERGRTGKLRDIVATIQGEQDEIIRAELGGVLVVQGGPGTGKTVVALHRAAYLLYTHRFPLEGQGVLVVGPNRVFLRYIDRVLPSLGEAGVELAVLADLVPDVRVARAEEAGVARVKGDERMADVVARAIRDRQRPLRDDMEVGYGLTRLRVSAEESARIVRTARRRYRRHNAGRRFVEQSLFAALAASGRANPPVTEVRERLRRTDEVRAALEWMWPVLSPAELLHDLYGSRSLLRSAGAGVLAPGELDALHRPRSGSATEVVWTDADVALLDESRALLGPRPRKGDPEDDGRTYGHLVIDEAQDLTPMQLRMLARRSLNGSMTVVGDIAQATGPFAPSSWTDVLRHLPERKPPRRRELTIGYRIPAASMALAARVLRAAAPELAPPVSVREGDEPPRILGVAPDAVGAGVSSEVADALAELGDASVAVIAPASLVAVAEAGLAAAGIAFGQADRQGLEAQVTVVPVGLVKGLELDAAVVLEPARIVAEEAQGLRALYVALTRATRRLAIVHAEPLPEAIQE